MVALDINNDARQKALLLHYVGDETNDIFDTLTVEVAADGETITDKVIQALTNHFEPKQNIEFAIYKFRQAQQNKEEDFPSYLTRLRQLAVNCNFTETERELKTQIIQGCASSRLRRKALSEPSMTLEKLIETARASETANIQASGMEVKPVVNMVRQKVITKNNNPSVNCRNCNGRWPHDGGRQACPAYGKTCRSCKKLHHFESVCRSKPASHNPLKPNFATKSKRFKPKSQINELHLKESSGSETDREYLYSIRHLQSGSQPKFEVTINGCKITIIADSGASVNIIDEEDFKRLSNQSLTISKAEVFPYGSSSALPLIGKFESIVEYNSNSTVTTFFVVKGSNGSLLGWETSTKLKLIEVVREIKSSHPDKSTDFIKHLTGEFADLFQGLGKLKNFKVRLHIDESIRPCAQPHRRVPFHVRKQLEEQFKADEALGVIEKVIDEQTPWVSPLVVVPKKTPGQVRVCVDMRKANSAILRERHITPTISEIIHDLNGACTFSKLDLNQGYNQLELDEGSRYITTFSSHLGLWRYKRLNFGVNSAAEVFQNAIREALSGISGVVNVSDDILVYGKTQGQHDDNLRSCFQRLREKGLTLNKEKCVYNKTSLDFLGYTFTKDGMEVDRKKIAAVVKLPNPTNQTEVRSLLGMTNFFSRFVPHYATITEPLRQLTHKDCKWKWSSEHDKAFDQLREALSKAPTLAYFDETKDTSIYVDASPVGIAAILTQKSRNDEHTHTISYASRALTSVEQRYSQTEREALAVVWACEHFHIYIYGKPVTVYTDHKPLISLYGNPNSKPPARIERWSLRLQPYSANIVYIVGLNNPADYMSRHPLNQSKLTSREEKVAEEYINFLTNVVIPKAMTLKEVKLATQADATLQAVLEAIRVNSWHKTVDNSVNKQQFDAYKRIQSELSVNHAEGIILRQRRIVIPQVLQSRAIQLAHEGHQGLTKTKSLVREKIWFPGIDKLVEDQIKSCLPCQAVCLTPQREPLQMSELPKSAWVEVSVDFATLDSEYLLVVLDEYSRFPIVEIVSSTSANVVIPKLDKIFSEYGIVDVVKSDNGPPFNSQQFKQFSNELGFHHRKITPLWPMANAEVERFMKTIKKVIKTASISQLNWRQEMYRFLRNYRATPHCTTGVAPATIFYNRPLNIKLPHLTEQSQDEVLRNRDANRKADMKEYADKKRYVKRSDLQEGDLVLVRNAPTLRKSSAPFGKDPYRIVNKNNSMITAESASGRKVTRNSSFFKKLDPKTIINEETRLSDDQDQDDDIDVPPDDPPNIIIPPDIVIPPNIVVPPNNVADAVEQVAPPATRERRQVRKPAWMKDFVMD